jgi:hypothetical protein
LSVVIKIGAVKQSFLDYLSDGSREACIMVPQGIDGDAADKVQILFPFFIDQVHAFTAGKNHRHLGIGVQQILFA